MDVGSSGALLATLAAGTDADLVALDESGAAHTVIVRGEVHVTGGTAVRRGTFEECGHS